MFSVDYGVLAVAFVVADISVVIVAADVLAVVAAVGTWSVTTDQPC